MPRQCQYTGRKTTKGNSYQLRGRSKRLGGVGTKITSKTRRDFRPNIQTVNAQMPDGSTQRVKASTKAIRKGLITKPLKRKYAYTRQNGS